MARQAHRSEARLVLLLISNPQPANGPDSPMCRDRVCYPFVRRIFLQRPFGYSSTLGDIGGSQLVIVKPMRCSSCETDNAEEARFCNQCGTPLDTASSLPTASEQPSRLTGERRQLTVLFCELVDSTAIASQLDPEDWRAAVANYITPQPARSRASVDTSQNI